MANGIQLSTNFDLKSALPLDDRLVVSNINDLNNLDNRYVGLTVYVTGENKYYYYDTTNSWVEFGSPQSPQNLVYTTGNQTISGVKTFVNTINIGSNPETSISGAGEQGESLRINARYINLSRGYAGPGLGFAQSEEITLNASDLNLNARTVANSLYIGTSYGEAYPEKFYVVGDSKFEGTASFDTRPTVNGTGVLLSGEAAQVDLNSTVRTTGNQTISGVKTFVNTINIGSNPETSISTVGEEGESLRINARYINLSRGYAGPGLGFAQSEEITLNASDLYLNARTVANSLYIGTSYGGVYPETFYVVGNSKFEGTASFDTRPTVNGTGVLLSGEAAQVDLNSTVRTTGNQTISGVKAFASRPTVNGTGVLLSGEAVRSNGTVNSMIRLTQAQYNALSPVDPTTFYVIIG